MERTARIRWIAPALALALLTGCVATPTATLGPTQGVSPTVTAAPTAGPTESPTPAPTATGSPTPVPTATPTTAPTAAASNVPAHYVDPREGKTTVDVANGWFVAQEGDWVYFANRADGDRLYRMKADGTETSLVSTDRPAYLNVVNGWLYYSAQNAGGALYRMRTDGTARARIVASACACILVLGDWIYYTDGGLENSLWRIHTYGGGKMRLTTFQTSALVIEGSWMYFQGFPTVDGTTTYRMYESKKDGTGQLCFMDNMTGWYDHGYVYISAGNALNRWLPDLSAHATVHAGRANLIGVADGWVYFTDYDDGQNLHRARPDGSEEQDLNSETVWEGICLGGWIYYHNDLTGGDLVRIRPDGTDRQVLG